MSCPQCRHPQIEIVESHWTLNKQARRIRRRCRNCFHGYTFFEVQQPLLDELRQLRLVKASMIKLLGVDAPEAPKALTCQQCKFWEGNGCDMDIPEAGGIFAGECSIYSPA